MKPLPTNPRFLTIDEEGFVSLNGLRVEDPEVGAPLLEALERIEPGQFMTRWDGQDVFVEAFDEPIVAKHVERSGDQFVLLSPYGIRWAFSVDSLSLDEWDRFHGMVGNKITFVFSRQAQFEFFDLVDSYDDDGITVAKRHIEIPPMYKPASQGGTLAQEEAQPLAEVLPQLKLNKARILLQGRGRGGIFSEQGHIVTAVDDFLQLPESLESFDLIYEHAAMPAISPEKRGTLVNNWQRRLVSGGHLLGIFLLSSKRDGPPYGISEWELRERLKKSFRFLYWTRWRKSVSPLGQELVVYAQKI